MSDSSGAIEPTSVQTGTEAAQEGAQPATTGETPAPTFGGLISGILNFVFLTGCFIALAAAAMWLKEKLHLLKERMRRDAELARRVAELCGLAGVDPYFLALFMETSQAFDRVADASGELSDAADQMEMNARFVKDAHDTEYGGIYEVANASPYAQPKPGFNTVR